MNISVITLTLSIVAITAYYWAAKLAIRLPELDPLFDRKPFNCHPCLSFHLTWILSTSLSIISGSTDMFWWGWVVAFGVFAIAKYINNKMIEK